jgi:hypothetical protein
VADEASVERRLAAILAGDVVGYSRLMGVDEEGTRFRRGHEHCGTHSDGVVMIACVGVSDRLSWITND